jgi:hypothetical protein
MENQSAQQSDPQNAAPEPTNQQPTAEETEAQETQNIQPGEEVKEITPNEPKEEVQENTPGVAPGNDTKAEPAEEQKVVQEKSQEQSEVSKAVEPKNEEQPLVDTPQVNTQNNQHVSQSNTAIDNNSQVNNQSSAPAAHPSAAVDASAPFKEEAKPVVISQPGAVSNNLDNSVRAPDSNRVEQNRLQSQNNASFPPIVDTLAPEAHSYEQDTSDNLKLFVGGLYYQSEDDVRSFFEQFGEIVE